jgi:glycosyltransferase involved in cell wall biosynthesis
VRRLALVTEIPAPYRIPLFNALASRLDLHVSFLRERNPDRPFALHRDELRFDWDVLPGIDATVGGRWIVVNARVVRRLRGADAILLGGWNQPAFLEAAAWGRLRHVPLVFWVESTGHDARSRLERLKRSLLRTPDGFVVPGSAARGYLEELGVEAERITVAPNAVDLAIFGKPHRTRTDGKSRIVAVARLSPEKGVDVLLRATSDLPVEVVVAGSGPEEPRLRRLAGPNVTFLGNVERNALPAVYANADVAVIPSRSDTWGMALNEAALAGLPLIASGVVGGSYDLIEEGVNGFRVPPDDPDALRSAISRLIEDETFRRAAGARSREIAGRFTPDLWADAVAGLVEDLAD